MSFYLNPVVDYQRANADTHETIYARVSRVLIIYTGGTIGMKASPEGRGFEPVPNWLCDSLRSVHRFNDSTRSSVPPDMHPVKSASLGTSTELPSLMTPVSVYGKRINYSILEYSPLLDSANMGGEDWIKIASDIEANYISFDAFVVLHGTDTMAYTASALSFMLENLGKTVIITGSQVPLAEWRTDAESNILGALLLSGHFVVPEVCLFFGNKLLRGNRSTKVDAMDFAAFDSPNMKPLATVGVTVDLNWHEIHRPHMITRFEAHKTLSSNVSALRVFPGITYATVKALLASPIQGVVLETFGAGNVPSARKDILDLLKEACDRGVVVVNCTQCKRGIVSDLYATGKALAALGVVAGSDMTPECALTKLSYLLAKYDSPDEVRARMQDNLRGELTQLTQMNIKQEALKSPQHLSFISHVIASMRVQSHKEIALVEKALVPHLVCATAGTGSLEMFQDLCDTLITKTDDHMNNTAAADVNVVNACDYDGRTALHVAAFAGHYAVVRALLEMGASVHVRDGSGRTPLACALYKGHRDVSLLLVATGSQIEQADQELVYLFFQHVSRNHIEIVRLFLECRMDVNVKSLYGQTALHAAYHLDHAEIIQLLLQNPVIDINVKDTWNKVPADYKRQ